MSILMLQHSFSVRQNFSVHSACSRQWPGRRPGQHTGQAAGSPSARARGRAAAPASGEARGEREGEMGVARSPPASPPLCLPYSSLTMDKSSEYAAGPCRLRLELSHRQSSATAAAEQSSSASILYHHRLRLANKNSRAARRACPAGKRTSLELHAIATPFRPSYDLYAPPRFV